MIKFLIRHFHKILKSEKGGIETLIAIGVGALAVGAVAEVASVIMAATTPKPKAPSAPAAPREEDAAKTAEERLTAQRKALLAAGGNTDITAGSASILKDETASKTLLGG